MFRLVTGLLSAALASLSGLLWYAETRAERQLSLSDSELAVNIGASSDGWSYAPSLATSTRQLRRCVHLMASPGVLLFPEITVRKLTDSCEIIATDTRSRASIRDLVIAVGTNQQDAKEHHLITSQRLAPNEGWHALARLRLSEGLVGYDQSHDIRVLLSDDRLIDQLAHLYAARPTLRDEIRAQVDASPAYLQRVFVSAVERMGR